MRISRSRHKEHQIACAAIRAALTPRQLHCLAAWAHDGLTQAQIGAKLGISRATVGRDIAKGLEELKRLGIGRKTAILPDGETEPMDPALMDRLGPRDVKERW